MDAVYKQPVGFLKDMYKVGRNGKKIKIIEGDKFLYRQCVLLVCIHFKRIPSCKVRIWHACKMVLLDTFNSCYEESDSVVVYTCCCK